LDRAKPRAITRMTTTFTIDRSGAVASEPTVKTEPVDSALSACVAKRFHDLSFPQPEGGTVSVTYPITAAREAIPKSGPRKSSKTKKGSTWGDTIGESFGAGGLGLSDVGEGGGGRGEGIGLGATMLRQSPP
jgi:hypothetical protein